MPGLGTIINVAAIIVGGIAGLAGGKLITERFQKILMDVCGIAVIFIGISGTLSQMLTVTGGELSTRGTMMMIGSLAIGSLIGEAINIEKRFAQFGAWLKKKSGSEKDGGFINAFLTASFTVCIGAMAVVGSLQDGILCDPSTLIAKAVLDLIIVMIMTASMGKGCVFSAIPVGILQGSVTLLSQVIKPILTEKAICYLSLTGSVLIFCVGLNLIREKKLKVANMLPTIVIAVIWALIEGA